MEAPGKAAGAEDAAFLLTHIIDAFTLFRSQYHVPKQYYHLDIECLTLSVTNAVSDRDRAAAYSSDTGASSYKSASFVGKWLAHDRPIAIDVRRPKNQVNNQLLTVNSDFATFVAQSLLKTRMYPRLFADLRYCFQFRSLRGEEINLLLDHALLWSPQFSTPKA